MAKPILKYSRSVEVEFELGAIKVDETQPIVDVTTGSIQYFPDIPKWMSGGHEIVRMRVAIMNYVAEERNWSLDRLFSYVGVGEMPFAYLSEAKLSKLVNPETWSSYDRVPFLYRIKS